MPARDAEDCLRDILDAVRDIQVFTHEMAEESFLALPSEDRRTYRAIKNAVAEIGEAVKGLPSEICARHPAVDWRGLAGLRDILSHRYFVVDLLRLWPVLRDELPVLRKAVESELPPGTETP